MGMKENAMRNLVIAVLLASLSVGCGYSKDIKEFPEPWQTLDPGKPPEKLPKIEILEQGGGAIIEPGDLVQLHIRDWSPRQNGWREMGDWWLWIGFKSQKETAFFSIELDVAGTTVGLRQGSALRFLEGKEVTKATPQGPVIDRSGQIQLSPSPFGDHRYYSWRKNTQDFLALSELSNSGYFSVLTIKRVCKGPLQYRTVRLFDDSPIRASSGGFGTRIVRDPREAWIDEARIEAKCNDGKTAVFQYGPTGSYNGKRGRSPVMGYFDDWLRDAWQKIPRGVQLK